MARIFDFFLCLLLLAGTATAEPTHVGAYARILNSVDGNQVRLSVDPLDRLPDGSGYVLICLENAGANTGTRGVSIGGQPVPSRLVLPGRSECRSVAPIRHRITLWTGNADGHLRRSMSLLLDMRNFASQVLRIQWLRLGE